LLLDKKKGDAFSFNDKKFVVEAVA